jgi:hypothetical protein
LVPRWYNTGIIIFEEERRKVVEEEGGMLFIYFMSLLSPLLDYGGKCHFLF